MAVPRSSTSARVGRISSMSGVALVRVCFAPAQLSLLMRAAQASRRASILSML